MPGIPREFAEHSVQINPGWKPVKQTMRRFSDPKRDAIEAEVDRLLAAKFIRELKKADWIANPVLVDKKNSEIKRMCVDFTSLNKRPLPIASNRPDYRFDCRMRTIVILGCIFWLSPDQDEKRR